ncbi:hypothetical protein F2P79_023504 [Pimephales promelas]|nr:hypothetical protein F2P79_023504 [Pimephales promelas]
MGFLDKSCAENIDILHGFIQTLPLSFKAVRDLRVLLEENGKLLKIQATFIVEHSSDILATLVSAEEWHRYICMDKSDAGENPGSSVLYELQMSYGLFGKASEEAITNVQNVIYYILFTSVEEGKIMGGALKGAQVIDNLPTIGIDETVHDLPAPEVPLDEPLSLELPILPGPQKVLSEDDIIGVRAAVLYENCLRQLVTFLTLPVNRCTGVLRTGLVCDSVAPFSTNIGIRGTAMSVEWICPNGHCLWRWNSQPVLKFGMQAGDFLLSTNILLSGNNYTKVALLFKFMNIQMVMAEMTHQGILPNTVATQPWSLTLKEIIHVATIDKRQTPTSWRRRVLSRQWTSLRKRSRHFGLELCIMFATITPGKQESANTTILKTLRIKSGFRERFKEP